MVELTIVFAVVVAPVTASATLDEAIGLVMECATFVAAGEGMISTTFTAGPAGIRCLSDRSSLMSKTDTITVASSSFYRVH